ncbi:MAG: aconitase X swivel domain-containing protein [Acidimicrobiia bacterium]
MESDGRTLVAGMASGSALVLEEPLSFWGGLDAETGEVIDRHHPQNGSVVTGKVVVMPHGRGSSSASAVLAEAIRLETAPAAVVMRKVDPIVMLGSLVAGELYGLVCPVVVIPSTQYEQIATGDWVEIVDDGTVRVSTGG